MHVLLGARRADRLQEMQRRIETEGGKADWFACDLGDFNQLEALITQIKERFGAPEILVNNAGFGWYGYLKDMPWNEADDLLRVNIVALPRLTQAFMRKRRAQFRAYHQPGFHCGGDAQSSHSTQTVAANV
jgi:short-subunit dehydrogenase